VVAMSATVIMCDIVSTCSGHSNQNCLKYAACLTIRSVQDVQHENFFRSFAFYKNRPGTAKNIGLRASNSNPARNIRERSAKQTPKMAYNLFNLLR
jgi:hypothetical protein